MSTVELSSVFTVRLTSFIPARELYVLCGVHGLWPFNSYNTINSSI